MRLRKGSCPVIVRLRNSSHGVLEPLNIGVIFLTETKLGQFAFSFGSDGSGSVCDSGSESVNWSQWAWLE